MAHQKSVAVADLVVTEVQAKARVNRLLLSQIGSQFCAGEPDFDDKKLLARACLTGDTWINCWASW